MRRAITALLVSAALAGSPAAFAQWGGHHRGDDNNQANQGGGQGGQGGQDGQGGSQGGQGGGQGGQVNQGSQGMGGSQWKSGQGGGQGRSQGGGNWKGNDNDGQGANWKGNNDNNDRWRHRDRQRGSWENNNKNWNNNNDRKWSNNWRNDRQWNWQSLRNRDRNRFHLPRYLAPRGHSYRRYSRGYRLPSFFFVQRYWFDAGDYGLPPAWGPYRWVRYFNDALLVNIYTGEIEDAIPNFFW